MANKEIFILDVQEAFVYKMIRWLEERDKVHQLIENELNVSECAFIAKLTDGKSNKFVFDDIPQNDKGNVSLKNVLRVLNGLGYITKNTLASNGWRTNEYTVDLDMAVFDDIQRYADFMESYPEKCQGAIDKINRMRGIS